MKKYLFCVPHAGGNAMFYTKLKPFLDPRLMFCPVELAGRGARFGEAPFTCLDEVVADIFPFFERNRQPYILMGYSMGSLIIYELLHRIVEEGVRCPDHVFLAAKSAPGIVASNNQVHLLPKDEFIRVIRDMEGTPQEFFSCPELMDLFIPVMRADYSVVENYQWQSGRKPLQLQATVLYGNQDDISVEDIAAWQTHFEAPIHMEEYHGGHFFINDHWASVADLLNRRVF